MNADKGTMANMDLNHPPAAASEPMQPIAAVNPLSVACPICRAAAGQNCNDMLPGYQHLPRLSVAIDDAKRSHVRIGPYNGEPHAIITLPDGETYRALLLQGETPMDACQRRRKDRAAYLTALQAEIDQLDTAIGIIARESQA